ncbi:unnamed protein product [Parnassius apollo]|uniref:(apollo) hypothetical protein n=1 Tax=Parnassius apollo TaxID=110799 RepID=A0A8S3XDV3_PARAO|nr:unnamed protein product [Parnassius apollo]
MSHCRALEIPAALDQALLLQTKLDSARKNDAHLAFSRVRNPMTHPELNHSHFPDLYYAAISYAKINKLVGDNFQLSQTHTSRHVYLIDRYIKKVAAAELGEMTHEIREKFARLWYPVSSRRQQSSDSEEDEREPPWRRVRRY